jgi:dTDP-4-dehydrorhamnose reductase
MTKIALLGSTGMIGNGLAQLLSIEDIQVTEFNRAGKSVNFKNHSSQMTLNHSNLDESILRLANFDYIINSIGLIRHKIDEENVDDVLEAETINSSFPTKLDQYAFTQGIRVIQIGTDCVYSGSKGDYVENDPTDPVDIYGRSKAQGESSLKATMNLRVSVIGKELHSQTELMEWVLHQPFKEILNGYVNHTWSGVTPLQLSKIIRGIVSKDLFQPGTQHLVPANKVSKYELIKVIASYISERELEIKEVRTALTVDRSLSTLNQSRNMALWSNAGYDQLPAIQDMIAEYLEWTGIDCSH